ncbi:nitrate- and nitrite sensing domain-containing protein [Sorangium sp. So ce1128]
MQSLSSASIRLKLWSLAGVPVAGALLLAAMIVGGAQQQAAKAAGIGSIEDLARLSSIMAQPLHALQKERAWTALVEGLEVRPEDAKDAEGARGTAPPFQRAAALGRASDQLRAARAATDESLADLDAFLAARDLSGLPARLARNLADARAHVGARGAFRSQADAKAASLDSVLKAFGSINVSLIRANAEHFADRIAGHDPRARAFLRMGWETACEDFLPLEVVLGQLPKVLHRDGRHLTLGFKPILTGEGQFNGALMVITDVTSTMDSLREYEQQREYIQGFERAVNWERVRDKAAAVGLPSATRRDLEAALFSPGFGTAEQVTDVSGRGVGLGVALYECRRLSGRVETETELGQGTTFRFRFPRELNEVAVPPAGAPCSASLPPSSRRGSLLVGTPRGGSSPSLPPSGAGGAPSANHPDRVAQ